MTDRHPDFEVIPTTSGSPDDVKIPFDDEILYYDMDGNVIEGGTLAWAKLYERADRQIGDDEVVSPSGEAYRVSTVWLGLDHSFLPGGPPLIFETMVFAVEKSWQEGFTFESQELPGYHYHQDFLQRRYATKQQALLNHTEICNQISRGDYPDDWYGKEES